MCQDCSTRSKNPGAPSNARPLKTSQWRQHWSHSSTRSYQTSCIMENENSLSLWQNAAKKWLRSIKTFLLLFILFILLLFQISPFAPEAEKAAGLRQWDGGPPEGKQQLPSSCFLPLDRPAAKSTKRKFLYTVFSWLFVKGRSGTLSAGLKIKSVKPPGIHFFGTKWRQVNFPLC